MDVLRIVFEVSSNKIVRMNISIITNYIFYCMTKLNKKNTKRLNEDVYTEISLQYVHVCEVPMKDIKKLTFEKISVFVGLVELLNMILCSQVSLGYYVQCDTRFTGD